MQRDLSVKINVDPNEEMLSVEITESQSGFTAEFGPTPLWFDWEKSLKKMVGDEIISWIEIMIGEVDEK